MGVPGIGIDVFRPESCPRPALTLESRRAPLTPAALEASSLSSLLVLCFSFSG